MLERPMLDRQKVEAILTRRFSRATQPEIASATNAIMGLGDEWEEVVNRQIDDLAREAEDGGEFRFFRRRVE